MKSQGLCIFWFITGTITYVEIFLKVHMYVYLIFKGRNYAH